ncbi:hypothetical protein [Rhizobium sp.]|uniref:hypothetical protein n=1 Tax=Rhizobium sp. TaxID=391 RepID=UPI000E8D0503|nr:hypothetical protein [Rhizobium sp.]
MTPEKEKLLIQINEDFEGYHRDVNAGLRIKRMPTIAGFRLRDLDLYAEFLDSGPAEQAEFMAGVHPDEIDFYEKLLMARIDFEIAEEKSGSITEDRVARNPDRYRWKPEE